MEFNPALPIYLQVMTMIKRDIVTGELMPGGKLPSVRDMAVQFAVNPNTVSRVYRELESEGICYTKRGMGTFVTEEPEVVGRLKAEMAGELMDQFLEGMKRLGMSGEEVIQLVKERTGC
ncbi:MAG TPA: GntR family transcriptional regulator [Candidatus Choladousia intestinigallinarum]|nr:GntR family transcriptional regulator [Candidatus Choladousia intestinigallinarum]